MNLTKTGWCLLIALTVAGVALVLLATGNRRDVRLSDGSRLVVEKMYFGKNQEPFEYGGWRERLKKHLPPALATRFFTNATTVGRGTWYQNTLIHTNDDALYIYVTRRAADTGDYADVRMAQVVLVDEHGCEFVPTQSGGEDDGRLSRPIGMSSGGSPAGHSVCWYRFEAFPRHQRNFRMRIYDSQIGKNSAELVLHNPAPPPRISNWATESLPIAESNGEVTFILTGAKIKTNAFPRMSWYSNARLADFTYEVREDGQVSSNWEALDRELYDSSGNFASTMGMARILCPQESAWKLRVRFFGSEQSLSTSNASWTLHGLAVPEPGEFIKLEQSQVLQGVEIKPAFFAGSGNFNYANGEARRGSPFEVQPNANLVQSAWNSSRTFTQTRSGRNNYTYKVQGTVPHFYVEIGALSDDQRLTARATDDQGREFYAYEWQTYGQPNKSPKKVASEVNYVQRRSYQNREAILGFDLASDSKTVDVTFCVHGCYAPEFIFKPPSH